MLEKQFYRPVSIPVLTHPLAKHINSSDDQSEPAESVTETSEVFLDPLGVSGNFDVSSDPIKAINNTCVIENKKNFSSIKSEELLLNTLQIDTSATENDYDPEFTGFRPWSEYRRLINKFFHSIESLQLVTSFSRAAKEDTRSKQSGQRLRPKVHELSETEYCRFFRELTATLDRLWEQEQRLECIRLSTEMATLLAQPSSSRFYPKKFVLVTDFLDHFGQLVFERLLQRASAERKEVGLSILTKNFETSDVLEKTRIRARNWFGKLSMVEDVIQRIYCVALLPCLRFMDQEAVGDNLMRLCDLAGLVNHPLTSSYARLYICRMAMRLQPLDRAPHWKCINDWMQTYQQQPVALLWPALEYIIQCVAYKAVTFDDLLPLWEYCRIAEKRVYMLKAMLRALPPIYLAEHALHASRLIASSEEFTADEICAFGDNLLRATVSEQYCKPVLRIMWKCIIQLKNISSYVACCETWVQFAARYFTVVEVEVILEHLVSQVTNEPRFEEHERAVANILKHVATFSKNITELLQLEIYLQLLQMLSSKSVRSNVSTLLLQLFVSSHKPASLSNVNIAFQLIDLCKHLHDALSIHTDPAEVTSVTTLICTTLDRINLNNAPEQHLFLLVASRAALINLDNCEQYVVCRFIELALFVVRTTRFSATRAAFIQACIANAYISTPSLENANDRIRLNIKAAQVALTSMTFAMVELFVNACLNDFLIFPSDCGNQFCALGAEFLSLLLVVPIPNVDAYLAQIRRFFNAIKNYTWTSTTSAEHGAILLKCVRFLYVLEQSITTPCRGNNQFRMCVNCVLPKDTVNDLLSIFMNELTILIGAESERWPLLSIQFLETLAKSTSCMDTVARPVAKIAYKRCKHADQTIVERMAKISFKEATS